MLPKEYIDDFENRLRQHISLVIKYGKILADYLEKIDSKKLPDGSFKSKILLNHLENHDSSKFSKEEREGYIWINAHFNLGIEYPDLGIALLAEQAWDHHKLVNDHHPEFWIDCNMMPIYTVAHMVADWKAMEFINDDSMKLREFWTKVGSKRYNWDSQHIEWIEDFINVLANK